MSGGANVIYSKFQHLIRSRYNPFALRLSSGLGEIMAQRWRRLTSLLLALLWTSGAAAQDANCPAMAQMALDLTEALCAPIGRNQVCYGNNVLETEAQPGLASWVFAQPGDLEAAAGLQTMRTSAMDTTTGTWGIALFKIQANVPDSLPGQNVTFVMFGDTEVQNVVPYDPNTPKLDITLQTDMVLLGRPADDAEIVGALAAGQSGQATGRSADSAWARVEIGGMGARAGWVPASALDSDISSLPAFNPIAPAESAMQAFRVQTALGRGGARNECSEAPDGLLVQTPTIEFNVELRINEVRIELGSTAFIQAQPNGQMTISLLEGSARVEALGQVVDVPAGSQVSVPMDADLTPAAPPGTVIPYDAGTMTGLPLTLLPREVTVTGRGWVGGQSVCITSAAGAWMRAEPQSASQSIVRVLPFDTAVAVNGEAHFDGVQSWWPVRTWDNAVGWVEQSGLAACSKPVEPPCTPRSDWPSYTVQPGDTLSRIAQSVGVSTTQLVTANCLPDPSQLDAWTSLRVPRLPATPIPPDTTIRSGLWRMNFVPRGHCVGITLDVQVTVTADGIQFTGYFDANGRITGPGSAYYALGYIMGRVGDGIYQEGLVQIGSMYVQGAGRVTITSRQNGRIEATFQFSCDDYQRSRVLRPVQVAPAPLGTPAAAP